jgi:hypothetical protein
MFIIAQSAQAFQALTMPSGVGLVISGTALDGRVYTGHGFSELDVTYGTANGAMFCEELPVDFVLPTSQTSTEEQEKRVAQEFEQAVTMYLDSKAAERGYSSILSAASRSGIIGSLWQPEGLAYGLWMDSCWIKCYQIMGAVKLGMRTMPTIEDVIAELPVLVLPAPVTL